MADFDLLENFLAFLHSNDGDGKKCEEVFCDRCDAALEVDPECGDERCPVCEEM